MNICLGMVLQNINHLFFHPASPSLVASSILHNMGDGGEGCIVPIPHHASILNYSAYSVESFLPRRYSGCFWNLMNLLSSFTSISVILSITLSPKPVLEEYYHVDGGVDSDGK